jgi:hypothetical protein
LFSISFQGSNGSEVEYQIRNPKIVGSILPSFNFYLVGHQKIPVIEEIPGIEEVFSQPSKQKYFLIQGQFSPVALGLGSRIKIEAL